MRRTSRAKFDLICAYFALTDTRIASSRSASDHACSATRVDVALR